MLRFITIIALFFNSLNSIAASIDVGILPFNPPYEMVTDDKNNVTGFEADIIKEICKRLSLECHFVTMQFNDLFTELNKQQIDLAAGIINPTPERERFYLFSIPFIESQVQFITPTASKFEKVDQLRGQKIGVLSGTVLKTFVLTLFNQEVEVIEYPMNPQMIQALMDGKIDAILVDKETGRYWQLSNSKNLEFLGTPFKLGMGYALMTSKNNTELIRKINQAILKMESDGTYLKLYNKYFSL